jgi:ketosteroid isomerase-like protein
MTTTAATTNNDHPANAPATPTEVVGGIYSAFGRGDMAGLFALLHPDIEWSVTVTAPGSELVPMMRHGIGHRAVEHYFGGVAQLEFHVFDIGRCFVDGDTVVAEVHVDATHRATGKRAQLDELHHWVIRDGLAVRFRPYVDTATLIELYRP